MPAKSPAKKAAPKTAQPDKAPAKGSAASKAAPAKKSAPAKAAKSAVPRLPEPAEPVPPPAPVELGKHQGRDILCQIEVLKDGHFFIARTVTEGTAPKEYKNTVFEDLLTEMLTTLQEQLDEKQ
ncbi:MAG TPA: hypothetical protein VFH47_07355 [Candidatus Thermoplasmatota archaeon]|nr:hypothetical protein [Candidatus Thermoplasmatota archaeon]